MISLADTVFMLPRKPRTAIVLGPLPGWPEALEAMEIEVRTEEQAGRGADLAVIAAHRLGALDGLKFPQLICAGPRLGRSLGGYATRRFVPLPSSQSPEVLLPLGARRQIRYALDRSPPSAAWKRARNHLVVAVLAAGVPPPVGSLVAVGADAAQPPFLIDAAAQRTELPPDLEWLLQPATGDPLSRAAFHLFAPGEKKPRWILKFARVPGYSQSFERDARGLELASAAGGRAAAHAPRLLCRFDHHGFHASVESAAAGRLLVGFLGSRARRRAKVAAIDRIAEWLLDVGTATRSAPQRLAAERERVKRQILPRWSASELSTSIDDLPPIPGVLQHNDLGTWNIQIDPTTPGSFTVLDWENARPSGFPLWDLWFFLQDALAVLDGFSGLSEEALEKRTEHAVRLFRGELASSPILFEWTRRAIAVCDVPPAAVGTLATLCFLHHGTSQALRKANVERHGSAADPWEMPWPRLAERWLKDPALGTAWDLWR